MRIKLTMRTNGAVQRIPINYNYPLAARIYRILSESSPEYSRFLHDRGYNGADGKRRKLFTFSRLNIRPKPGLGREVLVIPPDRRVELIIASAMEDDFMQHFIIGLFQKQRFEIANHRTRGVLHVEQVEALAPPEFTSPMTFRALSPIVLTVSVERDGRRQPHYLRPLEEGLAEAVRNSLLKKYETIAGRPPQDDRLEFRIDEDYIRRRGPERAMTLVRLREGQPEQTNVKGFLAPFTLSGSVDLMRTAWEAGIGDKCSMGFGCVGSIENEKRR